MTRHDHARTREWVAAGTEVLVGELDRLPDDRFTEPSLLPQWSVAHVAGHVARNAEALGRLVHWAATGEQTPMYDSMAQRNENIEISARQDPSSLRTDVRATAARLAEVMDALDGRAWAAQVRGAKGRWIPAAVIPWLRVREVWLHAVDLGTGVKVTDLPDDVVDCLLDDVTSSYPDRDDAPGLTLAATDRDRGWQLPGTGSVRVTGPAALLVGWLTGRHDGEGLECAGALPRLPPWL